MRPGSSSRMRMGEICKCENEVPRPSRAIRGSPPKHLPSGRQGVVAHALPVTYTHSHRVTQDLAPRGRAVSRPVSHALAVPPAPCHIHTHRVTHDVTRSVSHTRILSFSLSFGSLAPSRGHGAAWELPLPALRVWYPRFPSAPVQFDFPYLEL